MIKKKLKNGLTIIHEPRKTDSVAVEINVKTGSINETKEINGISHFIEHLVFKNTKNKTQKQLSSAIEDVGGTLNAFTDNERTAFHAQVLKKHFNIALEILSDIVLNPLFLEKDIEQERKVILREMNMYEDTPMIYQQMLLPNKLFQKHPLGNMIIGTKKSMSSITRKQVLDYYHKHYTPNNISIAVVGDIKDLFRKVEFFFRNIRSSTLSTLSTLSTPSRPSIIKEPKIKKPILFIQKRKIENSYFSLGFKTTSRSHKDSFVLDIINTILGEGMSSRFFQEAREKRGLVYSIKSNNKFVNDTGYFEVYAGIKKENIEEAKKVIFQEIMKLEKITPKELSQAKIKLEGNYLIDNEDNVHMATAMNYWETNTGKPEMAKIYPIYLKKVTTSSIANCVRSYFRPSSYAQVSIEEK